MQIRKTTQAKLEKALVKAEKLERELTSLSEKIAGNLQQPASRRDTRQIADSWFEVERLRPRMNSTFRLLREIKKPFRSRFKPRDYRAQLQMYRQAQGFVKRFRMWSEMESLVRRHMDPEKSPLLPKNPPGGQNALLKQIYKALHLLANPVNQNSRARDHGCYTDIAYPIQYFDQLMSAAYRSCLAQHPQPHPRFLDVGCGGGTKVIAASRFFRWADGLEYDLGYVNSARRTLQIIGAPYSRIYHADALLFDSYSDYDVIYFYRPMRTDALMEALEQQIIRRARPGTILVAPYGAGLFGRTGVDCAKVEDPIFITGVSQADADQIRQDAELTGTDILSRSDEHDFDTGYWGPILDSASFSGIERKTH